MPIKLVSVEKKEFVKAITKEDIQQLFDRYHDCTLKRNDKGGTPHDHKKNKDTKCGWFSLEEILALLQANNVDITNPKDYGIRIYFGHHHKDNVYQPDPTPPMTISQYYHHDTPILVVTKKNAAKENEDCLTEDTSSISLSPLVLHDGQGEDNAKLCPPECHDGESIS